jgi:hypothetical protein
MRVHRIIPLADRLWAKVDRNGPIPAHRPDLGPCWPWLGYIDPRGYATIGRGRAGEGTMYVHRAAYSVTYGPIPDGLVIDHLCRNKGCCNPSHLEAVPQRINVLRGEGPSARAHLEGRCLKGHALTPENSFLWQNPKRPGEQMILCRVCRRALNRAGEDRRKAKRQAERALRDAQ